MNTLQHLKPTQLKKEATMKTLKHSYFIKRYLTPSLHVGVYTVLVLSMQQVYAGETCVTSAVTNSIASGQYAVACGADNEANGDYSVAIGYANHADQESSIAVGRENHAEGISSSILGSFNTTSHVASTAVGANQAALGRAATAIGGHTDPLGTGRVELSFDGNGFIQSFNGIAVETTSKATDWKNVQLSEILSIAGRTNLTNKEKAGFLNSLQYGGNIAVGDQTTAIGTKNIAAAEHATSVGYLNSATGEDAVALGHANKASGAESTAVGQGNIASAGHATSVGYLNTATGDDSVALGHANTASGGETTAVGQNNISTADHATAVGYQNEALGHDSVAVGHTNVANGEESVALGSNSQVIGDYGVALGTSIGPSLYIEYDDEKNPSKIERVNGAKVTASGTQIKDITAIGKHQLNAQEIAALERRQQQGGNIVLGLASTAVGVSNFAADNGAVALGFLNTAVGQLSTAVGTSNIAEAHRATTIGFNNRATGEESLAVGADNQVHAENGVAVGHRNTVDAKNGSAFGVESTVKAEGATAIGYQSIADRANTVSVGQKGLEKQITNVAAATQATDAVNLAQMQAANQQIEKYVNSLERAFVQQRFETDRRFEQVDQRFDRQGAMSAAMMNMANSTSGLAGRNKLAVGTGFQGSEQAVAVGYQRMVNENTSLSISGAFSKDESSGGAGLGVSW